MSAIQITTRSIKDSPSIHYHVNKHFHKLKRLNSHITRCHVVVGMSQKHHTKGKLFNVCVDVSIPGNELLVSRKEHENLFLAIRNSFQALEKIFEKSVKKRPPHINKRVASNFSGNSEGYQESINL